MKNWRRFLAAVIAFVLLVPTIAIGEESLSISEDYVIQSESTDEIEETDPVPEDVTSVYTDKEPDQSAKEEAQLSEMELPPEEVALELGEEIAEPLTVDYAADTPEAHAHTVTVDPAAKAQTLSISVGDTVRVYVKDATVTAWKPGKKNIVTAHSGEDASGAFTEFHADAECKKLVLTATITGHKKKKATVNLVISNPYVPTAVSFTSEMPASVPLGATINLPEMVTLTPSYAVTTLTYKATGAAKAAKDGTLTTTKAGTATITVTASNNKKVKATFKLNVLANKVTGMSDKPGSYAFDDIEGGWTLWPVSVEVTKKGLACQFNLLNATGEKATKIENMELTLAAGTKDNVIAYYNSSKAISASVANNKAKVIKLTMTPVNMGDVFLPDSYRNGELFFDINYDSVRLKSKKNQYDFIPSVFPIYDDDDEEKNTPVTGITITQTSATMQIGEILTLTAQVRPANAKEKGILWTSSDNSVATVSNGSVTAWKAGMATITATATGDNTKKATCTIQIKGNVDDLSSHTIRDWAIQAEEFSFNNETGYEYNPEQRMAHNIYSDPSLQKTSGRYSAFSIDFKTEDYAKGTYWALCNWNMDISELRREYTVTDAGGAYAGLQNTIDGPMGIMSFWEIHYLNDKGKDTILRANRVYPAGAEHRFDGEGEGTNYLGKYNWENDHWYRMMIRCYDQEDGRTIVEQWFMDLQKGDWVLFSAFNTNLQHSFFVGGMSQFMENYDAEFCNEFRSFQYKNICVKEYDSGNWVPITESTLSTDTWWDNKKGNYAFGSAGNSFWGITCGFGKDIIKENNHGPESKLFSVKTGEIPIEP